MITCWQYNCRAVHTPDARQWYFQNSLQLNSVKSESLIVGTSHQLWAASSVDLLLLTRWKHWVSRLISVWISTVSCATTTCRLSTTYVIWSHVDISLMLVWSCPALTTATLSSTAHHLAPSECVSLNVTSLESVCFDELDIISAIKKLKSNFTCGPDGIPPMFFKQLNEVLAFPLTMVYRQLLSVSYVPDIWKQAIIIPVHKKRWCPHL